MTGNEKFPLPQQPERVDFSGYVDHLMQAYTVFLETLRAGESVALPKDGQLLGSASLLAQASNYLLIDTQDVPAEALNEQSRLALQAALRFHMLESLAIGSTPESYELYDAVDDPRAFIASVEAMLEEKSVAVGAPFAKASEYARHIAYDKDYNDAMFSKITFSERRRLFETAALSLSQPYFDQLQTLIDGAE